MTKPIRSAYEVALDRELSNSIKEDDKPYDGFFVDDRPSKILGSRANHPIKLKNDSVKKQELPKSEPKPSEPEEQPVPIRQEVPTLQETNKEQKMNAYLTCNITLSNKLSRIIKEGSTASLFMGPFNTNKASGHLRLEIIGDNLEELKNLSNTSIMLEVVECGEDVPEMDNSSPVQSFGTGTETVIKKVAVTSPKQHPANKQTVYQNSSVTEEEKKQAIEVVSKTMKKNSENRISTYDDLIAACNSVPGIDASPVPSKKPKNGNRFTRAEAMEYEKELLSLPKLKQSVYVKNNFGSRIEIGDISLGENSLILAPYEVFDLSRLSAKMIRDSANLRSLLLSKSNYLSIGTKFDFEEWINEKSNFVLEERGSDVKAFSGENAREMAENAIYNARNSNDGESRTIPGKVVREAKISESAMEITSDELNTPLEFDSEETTQILRDMPKERPQGFQPVSEPRIVKSSPDDKRSIRRI